MNARGAGGNRSPCVVLANWFQFGPNETIAYPSVESRMFLWCRHGKGSMKVNNERFELAEGDWAFLPWGHAIRYVADVSTPFLVGGIHIIPSHSAHPPESEVAHTPEASLAGSPHRCDAPLVQLHGGLLHGRFGIRPNALESLVTYVIERFQSRRPTPPEMRLLAELVLDELRAAVACQPMPDRPRPAALRRMQDYALAHLDRPAPGVDDLARLGNCSPATVHRLFQAFEATSPARWVAAQRAARATRLLQTTLLSVQEVASRVGMDDPFHFSRFVKRLTGYSPTALRRQRGQI